MSQITSQDQQQCFQLQSLQVLPFALLLPAQPSQLVRTPSVYDNQESSSSIPPTHFPVQINH
ncbi:hypothetical protein HanXRQr2_Chr17g0788321 [Helianthus annuus]|uniref:Uncharacterized protein n=1 Tax=Helianthus annuus TaxID=4232 RepID=A0A9K3GSU1_HELAN|nr:hypothetical protein HanXRQr2_Chr17g0788321 [Helianthus annuus]KAJ0811952.1 hypothetical protein HanPSC8_Chr17g0756441 [Helianthus annuus]